MLLYTNTLKIRDTLTPDDFIALAIQWNQGSSWSENVIRDISWNGEHSVRLGTDDVWMAIEDYHGGEIIAVRYQKTDEDGTAWISDFVMDFADCRNFRLPFNKKRLDFPEEIGKTKNQSLCTMNVAEIHIALFEI